MRTVIAGLGLLTLCGCRGPEVGSAEPMKVADPTKGMQYIASVESMGIQGDNVLHVLDHAGITCLMAGSRGYGVSVPHADADRATKLLIADAKDRPYEYMEIAGYPGKLGFPAESTWPLRKFDVELDKAEGAPEFAGDPNLRGLALEAQKYENDNFTGLDLKTVRITGMRLFKMDYMDAAGKIESGYRAQIILNQGQPDELYALESYSWDGGQRHETSSGGTYTPGK